MKHRFLAAAIAAATILSASALDIKGALGKLKKGSSNGSSATEALTGLANSLLSSDNITLDNLHGTWTYKAPAVTFKSDDLLKKAGGAAAAEAIEGKIAPYYTRVGIDKLVLTVNDDNTFEMKLARGSLKGTIEEAPEGSGDANFVFNFKAGGKLSLGKMNAYVKKSALGDLSVMFDITKLVSLLTKLSSVTSSQSIKAVSSALSSYDGVCAGFDLAQQK